MFFTRYRPIAIAHKLFEAAEGSNKRPPVIFMHGLMEQKETWKTIPQRIADETKRKVYAFDARNHGESQHTMDSNFDNNVYDLYHFMDKMKIDRTILVGHNMGGMTAIKAALQQPSKIETAFIVDMHVDRIPSELLKQYFWFMTSCAVKVLQTPKDAPNPNLARVHVPPPLEEIEDEGLLRAVMTFRLLAIMDALMQYDKSPTIPDGGEYHEPAYFIYGTESPDCVEDHIDNIKKFFPAAEMISFEGASSKIYQDYQDEFVKVLSSRIPQDKKSRWF